MPKRRMFTKDITQSDAFLDMPSSAQSLYFHLNMNADDDGFVGNPKVIMRMINASNDDFKLLLVKRFILSFNNGVIVIKHWRMHNLIRNDRYKETQYLEEKSTLFIKENGAYTDNKIKGLKEWQPNGNQMDTQVRVGKDKIGKDNTTKVVEEVKTSYGNPNINILVDFLKEKLGGSPDGTIKDNRRFCKLLLDKFKRDYPEANNVEQVKFLIEGSLKDSFHSKNATSFKYLYYNSQKIIQSLKGQINNPKVIKIK